MGLKDLIKAYFLKRNVSKAKSKTAIESSVDNLLADEMKTMTATNRTIDKLLKVKIMRQETQHTLNKIGELDEEYEDEPEDEGEDFEEGIKKMLMNKILGGAAVTPKGTEEAIHNPILEAVDNLTPQQTEQLKKKFLGM